MNKKEFAEKLIESLTNNPEAWSFGPHTMDLGTLCIWIANRPYADLHFYPGGITGRIGTRWQRRKIRKLIDAAVYTQAAHIMASQILLPKRSAIDAVLKRLENISK